MRWLAASTAAAPARVLNGLASVPLLLVPAAGLTNQVTGPEMLNVTLAAVLHAVPGLPLSQTVNGKLTVPVTPGAGSKVKAPVSASATTVPTFAIVVVIVPLTGATPLTVPTSRSSVKPASFTSASVASLSRPSAVAIDR